MLFNGLSKYCDYLQLIYFTYLFTTVFFIYDITISMWLWPRLLLIVGCNGCDGISEAKGHCRLMVLNKISKKNACFTAPPINLSGYTSVVSWGWSADAIPGRVVMAGAKANNGAHEKSGFDENSCIDVSLSVALILATRRGWLPFLESTTALFPKLWWMNVYSIPVSTPDAKKRLACVGEDGGNELWGVSSTAPVDSWSML